ncbi:hypothetical protein [Bacillus sp. 1P06AnD]|uniref:hypothetical protein n=1 Tax=Bacillus sp. 1P06AnD TaxID=3132208 RepID=UPI0039A3C9C0
MAKEQLTEFSVMLRKRIEEFGVNLPTLHYIDQLTPDTQNMIYKYLVEIMDDELLFVITRCNNEESEEKLKMIIDSQSYKLN